MRAEENNGWWDNHTVMMDYRFRELLDRDRLDNLTNELEK